MARNSARTLEDLELQFQQISERATALATSLDTVTLARRPKPESWSVAECLTHLNLSVDAYFPLWKHELSRAQKQVARAKPTYRLDFWGWLLFWTLEPP